MAVDFRFIIIGRGMMGAAVARHLSSMADGIALIGPREPEERKAHHGVFASHYDEARITRTFDGNLAWGTFAARALDRYREIEARSGISFYSEVGCLFAAPEKGEQDYIKRALTVSRTLGSDIETIAPLDLRRRFPYLAVDPDFSGYFERRRAGYINPRALVRAQTMLAEQGGVSLIEATATSVRDTGSHVEVTAGCRSYGAERVLVAAGGFSNFHTLLPRPVDTRVMARTVAFYELGEREMAVFGGMPSTIVLGDREEDHIYILPPVRYPDGKTYLKLGGDTEALSFSQLEDAGAWFRSDGSAPERDHLARVALQLMPELAGCPVTSAPCVANFTPTGYPYAGFTQSPRIAVLTGGNFVAAKSSDELGRLGAVLLAEGRLGDQDFGGELTPVFG
ncbi:NAD(P)/FAD-dependent oxidoreductase [Rhizobium leguminosarum]|jgi:sarcosine oxidase|uniref:NAD(P)/FAD-dependent oxidoreductase n=1 Tax=Rhizobium TaxID=379 RepID=UPI00103163AD|nr:FAD-binding oxidoreductase [Rhizobium leguminosarum]MDH6657326.1 glycine/D-amino acid oxidase-like deaminating enzyme [Rhizobium sophorae]MBB4520888.1 sarcosine oxidase [Rhizobium leguminosarum]QIO70520.1 FAD-binding oxidoreductase [Rhizobium leguminosarum bv. trifolii]QIO77526.1 FAD-binding oxidoreductase [Rhizobium leguminosarum bv. trifolii]TAU21634.1 FAD-binding oxidoreductase [Rhizobium leguminosarum]